MNDNLDKAIEKEKRINNMYVIKDFVKEFLSKQIEDFITNSMVYGEKYEPLDCNLEDFIRNMKEMFDEMEI